MRFEEIRAQLLHRPMTRYQILTVAIAMLVNMVDGFDLLAISFAGPAIGREWMLGAERLGELFSAGLLGMAADDRLACGIRFRRRADYVADSGGVFPPARIVRLSARQAAS